MFGSIIKGRYVFLSAALALLLAGGERPVYAAAESGCAACHTNFGSLKKSLTNVQVRESALTEGMG